MKIGHHTLLASLSLLTLLMTGGASAQVIDNTFTYQGYLEFEGQPANGPYDFLVYLVDEEALATSANIVDSLAFDNHPLNQGVFSLELDFADGLFDGTDYWLDVRVRQSGTTVYTVFNTVDKLNAVPYTSLSQSSLDVDQVSFFESNGNGIGYTGGRLEIGGVPSSANSLLQVDAPAAESPFRARIGGSTRLRIHENGGTSLGINDSSVPDNGLLVQGDSVLRGDVSQPVTAHGIVKAGIVATCSTASTVDRFFNNVNTDSIVIDPSQAMGAGSCAFTVPFDLNEVFIQATVIRQNDTRLISCSNSTASTLICNSSNTSGTSLNSIIHVLLY